MLVWIAALLCFLPWDSGQLISGERSSTGLSCNHSTSCYNNADCIGGMCFCQDGYQFYEDDETHKPSCMQCPEAHQTCDSGCCYPADSTTCSNKVCICLENNDSYACSILFQRDQFKLATEICLGAAIAMVVLSLVIVIAKSWLRRHQIARRDAPRGSDTSASSITSIQLLVTARLRDRPPGYNDRRHIRIEKPPSYEDSLEQTSSRVELQVPVTTQRPADPSESASSHADTRRFGAVFEEVEEGAVGGLVNPAFVVTDQKDECDNCRNSTASELHM